MIKLHLLGSYMALFAVGGKDYTLTVRQGCVTCTAARKMLKLGVDPAEKIDVRRDGEPAFVRCHTVEWWSEFTVVETAAHGPRFRRLRSAKGAHSGTARRSGVVGTPPNDTPTSGPPAGEDA